MSQQRQNRMTTATILISLLQLKNMRQQLCEYAMYCYYKKFIHLIY